MPDGNFVLTNDLLTRHFFGPGADSLKSIYPSPNLAANLTKNSSRNTLNISAKYSRDDVSQVDPFEFINCLPIPGSTLVDCPDERGIVQPIPDFERSSTHNYSAKISSSYRLGPRDTVTVANAFNASDYTKIGSDFSNNNATLLYSRKLTKRLDATLGIGVNWLGVDNSLDLDRFTYNINAKLTQRLNNRLNVRAATSWSLIDTRQDSIALGASRNSDLTQSGWGNLGFDLLMTPVTTLTGDATVFTNEGQDHDFLNRLSTTLTLSHDINERSSAKLASSLSINEVDLASGKDTSVFLTISPSYNLELARNWNMSASYKFIYSDSGTETSTSNEVLFTLAHDFYLFH
jgi:hypothetical protein